MLLDCLPDWLRGCWLGGWPVAGWVALYVLLDCLAGWLCVAHWVAHCVVDWVARGGMTFQPGTYSKLLLQLA